MMTQTQTLKPWKITEYDPTVDFAPDKHWGGGFVDISAPDWDSFARVVVRLEGDKIDNPKGLAYARLIAAAPEMLAACQRVLLAIQWSTPSERLTPEDQATLLRAVIARATGTP
jgi:hypothetical protein